MLDCVKEVQNCTPSKLEYGFHFVQNSIFTAKEQLESRKSRWQAIPVHNPLSNDGTYIGHFS
jgi:hypothetical protein